jgi:molybdenum cofactor cytidylyltransferase
MDVVLPAVILAAGASTRMGSPKALLAAPDGQPFVVRIARTLREAGVPTVVVVTGADHDAIEGAISRAGESIRARCVRNPDPSRGQLSSLWVGLDALLAPPGELVPIPACLVTLVDVPMLQAETVRRVVEAWRRSKAPIVRPALGDRHGHPVLFDRSVFAELQTAPLDLGAKAVIRAHEAEIWNEPVTDAGCLADVDTPQDYERLARG